MDLARKIHEVLTHADQLLVLSDDLYVVSLLGGDSGLWQVDRDGQIIVRNNSGFLLA